MSDFNLTFTEAVELASKGGMVVGEHFDNGVALVVNKLGGAVMVRNYKDKDDINATEHNLIVSLNIVNMKFKEVFTRMATFG